jgi:hypothetical protein
MIIAVADYRSCCFCKVYVLTHFGFSQVERHLNDGDFVLFNRNQVFIKCLSWFSAWHSEEEKGFITPGDTMVRIEKGELLPSTLCKKSIGTGS